MTVATRAEADAEVRLAAGEEHRWTVEAAPADGAVIGVEFEARVDAPDLSGSMYFMELLVDGVPVDASIDRLRHRLRNKAAVIGGEPALAWQLPDIAWRVVYAPSFDPAHTGGHGPEGFRFVLDLDGLAHAGSTIAIRRRHVPFCDADLVVRGLRTIDLPGADEPPAGWVLADGTLHVTDDGAVQVGGGGGGGAGAVWRTNVRVGPAAGQIGPAGLELDGLRIDRRATIADGRVHVTDRLINTTDRDLGVVFEHALALPAPAPEVRLGGPETPGVVRTWAPWNPTLFAPLGPVSVGLVVEDDAQRAQCVYRYDGTTGTATARTERLVVGARGTVELTTALYALPHADYFDFATRIRQDWGVTVTLDGPY
ncbi:MAG: hypothetical protein QOI20_2996, partial [Acidimicrobiaceae bacterium]|nr:hypothetical protein [Acidimicrobiaceae bacterium]